MPVSDSEMSGKDGKNDSSSADEDGSYYSDLVINEEPYTMCIEPDTLHLSDDEMDSAYQDSEIGSPYGSFPERFALKQTKQRGRVHRYSDDQNLVITEAFDSFIEGKSPYPPSHDVECFLVLNDFMQGDSFEEKKKRLRIKLNNMRRLHKMRIQRVDGRKSTDKSSESHIRRRRSSDSGSAPSRYRLYTVEENLMIQDFFADFIENNFPYPSRDEVEEFITKHDFVHGNTLAEKKANLRTKLNNTRRLFKDHTEKIPVHKTIINE